MAESEKRSWAGLGFAVVVFATMPVAAAHKAPARPVFAWVVSLVFGALILAAIGKSMGHGLLSDERNRWSLSRFQLLVWSWLLLSSMWALVVLRLVADAADPLALNIDSNLLLLLGISSTSIVASPMILARKEKEDPGVLDRRPPGQGGGSVADFFQGEEQSNSDVVDIGRVQLFFFTIIGVIVYGAALYHQVALGKSADVQFAVPSQSLVALLGISHATFLANKIQNRPDVAAATSGTKSDPPQASGLPRSRDGNASI